MSRFFSPRFADLTPYEPGEQPKDRSFIKLNTNESPFPPSETAQKMAKEASERLQLYPDPQCSELTRLWAESFDLDEGEILWTNGSDDILNFAFMAFCDGNTGAAFSDVTYGFYSVFAKTNGVDYLEIPLRDDLAIEPSDYFGLGRTIFIANPNAPTGIALSVSQIEQVLKNNPDHVVVIDEAYVDFGGESCIPLIHQYDNLLVTQTFSKSRSMAGARLGVGIGCKALIRDLNTIKYSTNPYNINRMTMAAGIGTLMDREYTVNNCKEICRTREFVAEELEVLGFEMTTSFTNFLFIRHPLISGKDLYLKLKESGILVRHFNHARISDYCRVTVGSRDEMTRFLSCVKNILEDL